MDFVSGACVMLLDAPCASTATQATPPHTNRGGMKNEGN